MPERTTLLLDTNWTHLTNLMRRLMEHGWTGGTATMITWVHKVVQWPLSASVIAVVTLSAVVPWLGVRLLRRIRPHPAFKENNELVGFTYSVYGLI